MCNSLWAIICFIWLDRAYWPTPHAPLLLSQTFQRPLACISQDLHGLPAHCHAKHAGDCAQQVATGHELLWPSAAQQLLLQVRQPAVAGAAQRQQPGAPGGPGAAAGEERRARLAPSHLEALELRSAQQQAGAVVQHLAHGAWRLVLGPESASSCRRALRSASSAASGPLFEGRSRKVATWRTSSRSSQ